MKHFLKPVGHCLTTIVITSAILRIYGVPIADAASPDIAPTIENSDIQVPTEAVPSAPPAAVVPPTNTPTVETIVAPSVAGAVTTPITTPAQTASVEAAEVSSPAPLPNKPTQTIPEAEAEAAPEPQEAVQLQNRTSGTSEQSTTSSPRAVEVSPQTGTTQPPSNLAKDSPAKPRTIAEMRQTLDQKLAAIVARDREIRENQLRQNLIASALYYAQTGAFTEAYQVAQNPALPTEVQTELLAKINELAVLAGVKPITPTQVAAASETPTTTASARPVPPPSAAVSFSPVYPSTSSSSAGAAWVGSAIGSQCPATAQPGNAAASTKATADSGKPSIPQLGKKSAAALVAIAKRQKSVSPKSAQPAAPSLEASPVKVQPVSEPSVAQKPTALNLPSTSKQTSELKPVVSQSMPQQGIDAAPTAEPFNLSANPATQDVGEFKVEKILGSFFKEPLKEVNITLSGALPDVIKSAFGWWAPIDKTSNKARGTIVNPANSTSSNLPSSSTAPQTHSDALSEFPVEVNDSEVLQAALDDSFLHLEHTLPVLQPQVKNAVKVAIALPKTEASDAKLVAAKTTTPQTAPLNCFGVPVANQDVNATFTPAVAKQMGWGNLVFPLPIPSVLTSTFGWRVHPISGDRRFHTGIDLGADMGTPVVSAQDGRVVAADSMGGYGLAVIVENTTGNYRTLYGHLSGIAVRPGTVLKAGTVVGWVGSTGNSTGPHLHFETLILTNSGWTAIDPLTNGNTAVAQAAQ